MQLLGWQRQERTNEKRPFARPGSFTRSALYPYDGVKIQFAGENIISFSLSDCMGWGRLCFSRLDVPSACRMFAPGIPDVYKHSCFRMTGSHAGCDGSHLC
eukprot:5008849-Amphidinium_carterae.1